MLKLRKHRIAASSLPLFIQTIQGFQKGKVEILYLAMGEHRSNRQSNARFLRHLQGVKQKRFYLHKSVLHNEILFTHHQNFAWRSHL